MGQKEFFEEIGSVLKKRKLSKAELSLLKVELCQKHGLKKIPTDFDILLNSTGKEIGHLRQLQSKPGRTSSGVAVVAVMTQPSDCPHGRCTYCPGGLSSKFGDVPQSYTGKEPATLRGIRNNYDPYLQVFNRLEQYTILGHAYDKIELIIMGGTFISLPKKYREEFVGYCLKAMNDFSRLFYSSGALDFLKFKQFFLLPGRIEDERRTSQIRQKLLKLKGKADLEKEQAANERAGIRCVAMCIESRPDYCLEPQIDEMLRLGATRIEMGVQSLDDKILKRVKRGHTVAESIKATKLLKDSFLKVGYHMMPGLPGATEAKDLAELKKIFSDQNFRPDALKIYPCMVMPGTELSRDYKDGKFTPLSTEMAASLIAEFKQDVPEYCRIMRIQRDIPSYVAEAGVDRTNLRQYVDRLLKEKNIRCRCIRCREPHKKRVDLSSLKIFAKAYEASGGTEVFISAEDTKNDLLLGFCRLRIPSKPFRQEITNKSAGIRELHVYGEMASIGKEGLIQHRGIGKKLLSQAEEIAKKVYGKEKMVIISGIGVREYYAKREYSQEGPYMVKKL